MRFLARAPDPALAMWAVFPMPQGNSGQSGTRFNAHRHWGGEEIYVLSGTFYDQYGVYPEGSWIRSPHLSEHQPFTRGEGALIFVKTGHLKTYTKESDNE